MGLRDVLRGRYGIAILRCVKSQKIADPIFVCTSVSFSLSYLIVVRLLPILLLTSSGYKYGLSILKKETTDAHENSSHLPNHNA